MSKDNYVLTEEEKAKILLSGKYRARWNTIITILSIILLLIPVGYLSTIIFYSINNNANNQITTLETMYSVTKPNMEIDDSAIESEFNPTLGLNISAPIKNTVGDLEKKVGTYHSNIIFGKIKDQNISLNINEAPSDLRDKKFPFVYGGVTVPSYLSNGWSHLDQVPKGTVAEVYLSFDKAYTPKEVKNMFKDKNVKIVWNAVYTGMEEKMEDLSGSVVTPVGYPENNSPFENSDFQEKPSQELFLDQMDYLDQHKGIVEQLMGEASLAGSERIHYLNKNGVMLYGVVITGPSKEILKLEESNNIRALYVNQVDLWNWNKEE